MTNPISENSKTWTQFSVQWAAAIGLGALVYAYLPKAFPQPPTSVFPQATRIGTSLGATVALAYLTGKEITIYNTSKKLNALHKENETLKTENSGTVNLGPIEKELKGLLKAADLKFCTKIATVTTTLDRAERLIRGNFDTLARGLFNGMERLDEIIKAEAKAEAKTVAQTSLRDVRALGQKVNSLGVKGNHIAKALQALNAYTVSELNKLRAPNSAKSAAQKTREELTPIADRLATAIKQSGGQQAVQAELMKASVAIKGCTTSTDSSLSPYAKSWLESKADQCHIWGESKSTRLLQDSGDDIKALLVDLRTAVACWLHKPGDQLQYFADRLYGLSGKSVRVTKELKTTLSSIQKLVNKKLNAVPRDDAKQRKPYETCIANCETLIGFLDKDPQFTAKFVSKLEAFGKELTGLGVKLGALGEDLVKLAGGKKKGEKDDEVQTITKYLKAIADNKEMLKKTLEDVELVRNWVTKSLGSKLSQDAGDNVKMMSKRRKQLLAGLNGSQKTITCGDIESFANQLLGVRAGIMRAEVPDQSVPVFSVLALDGIELRRGENLGGHNLTELLDTRYAPQRLQLEAAGLKPNGQRQHRVIPGTPPTKDGSFRGLLATLATGRFSRSTGEKPPVARSQPDQGDGLKRKLGYRKSINVASPGSVMEVADDNRQPAFDPAAGMKIMARKTPQGTRFKKRREASKAAPSASVATTTTQSNTSE